MSQLTQGKTHRLMYVENKSEAGDRGDARIGWVTFSKTGRSIYYQGRRFQRTKGGGIVGNYFESETGDEYWNSGVKRLAPIGAGQVMQFRFGPLPWDLPSQS